MSKIVSSKHVIVRPLNGLVDFSPKNNASQIQFSLGGTASQMIDMTSLRLNYKARILMGTVQGITQRPNNFNPLVGAGGSATANAQVEQVAQIDERTGLTGCWANVSYTNANNDVLESFNDSGRVMASFMPLTMSSNDYITYAGMTYGGAVNQNVERRMINADIPQSHRLYTGLTLTPQLLPLAMVGKLNITISMSNSNFLLFGANADDNGGATFQLRDLFLSYKLIQNDSELSVPKSYPYKSFSSFNQTITANDYQNIYSFNQQNVLSVISTFMPSTFLNNYAQNSLQTLKLRNSNGGLFDVPVEIVNSNFLKNSVKNPLQFDVNEELYIDNLNPVKNTYDTQRSYYYAGSLTPFYKLNHCLISPFTEGLGGTAENDTNAVNPEAKEVYGLAINYDMANQNIGTSFARGNTFSQRIKSNLDGQSVNQIFTLTYSTKELVPTMGGSKVVQ